MIDRSLDHSTVELINWNGTDVDVARNAKVSYNKDLDERLNDPAHVKGLINFLIREGHMSPFDHGTATFLVETPIFVAREFMRHRTGQFNEISGRYSTWDFKFYVPNPDRPLVQEGKAGDYRFVPGSNEQYATVLKSFEKVYNVQIEEYEKMIAMGIAKEVARDVLGLNLFTRFYATFNTRNLMHFLNLRTADNALYEIREVADAMEAHFEENMPHTYAAWRANR